MNLSSTQILARLSASVSLMAALCITTSHAQTANNYLATHPLAGTWSWTLFNSKCTETLQYRTDGVLLGTSGDAVTEWRYIVSSPPDSPGFYKVDEVSTRHNAKKDCSGDTTNEIGLDETKYIQLNPTKNQMIICKTASLQACYGPLRRLP